MGARAALRGAHPAGRALVLAALTAVALQAPAAAGASGRHQAGPGAPTPVRTGDWPLDRARAAVATLSFIGVVEVAWTDRQGPRTERLTVRAAGGVLEVRGLTTALSDSAGARLLRRPDGSWDLLWSGAQAAAGRPDAAPKYQVLASTRAPAPTVAGRPATLFEVHEGPALRERIFLDDATGILLRREQVDAAGVARRVVGFSSITLDPAMTAPSPPPAPANRVPTAMSAAATPAPAVLPGGYRRTGAYREAGAVQVLYSDGLYDLSVFEQRSGLASRDVPAAGTPVTVGRGHGWAYAWAGGQILLWHAGHTLYTLVGDAPLDHLVDAAAALPAAGGAPSLVDRLRRSCASILEPLAG